MLARAPRPTAGFTLIEAVIVCAFVAVFAVFLAGTIVTSTTMNRDTYVENEVVDLANRTADELAAALASAGRLTDGYDLSVLGDRLEFQQMRYDDATGNRLFGVFLPPSDSIFSAEGVKRLIFFPERSFIETQVGLDINGSGGALEVTPVVTGRLELRTYVQPNLNHALLNSDRFELRRVFGGGTVRFCQRPRGTGVIFARPPHYSNVLGPPATVSEWALRDNQIVRTEDDVNPTAGSNPVVIPNETAFADYAAPNTGTETPPMSSEPTNPGVASRADPSVRLNLRIVYNPVPGIGNKRELHALSLVRTVTLR